jgi:riboflavin kinase / FMN adenylyltransferase
VTPTAIALGNFDGVHRGHQQVVRPVLPKSTQATQRLETGLEQECRELAANQPGVGVAASQLPYATVVSFNPHPQEFFSGQPRALLTPPDEKAIQLRSLGVEQLVLLPFDRELANLSPQQFVEDILIEQLKSTRISVGEDFRFGYKRAGTSADLKAIAATYGIETIIVPLYTYKGERISSSIIRQALTDGDITRANHLLGRSYSLRGSVVQGQQLGRTIGFPTANLQLPSEKFLPRQGVYAVEIIVEQQQETKAGTSLIATDSPSAILGVMNIGFRPTVNGTSPTVEVHLINWTGDLYGKTLTVSLKQFLRPEQKFASLDALKAQIQADCVAAKLANG